MFKLLIDSSTPQSDRQKVRNITTHTRTVFSCAFVSINFTLLPSHWSFCPSVLHVQAAQNLVVLSREDAGAEQIFRNDGVKLLQRLLESKYEDIVLSALRTLVGLCTGHQSRVSGFDVPTAD